MEYLVAIFLFALACAVARLYDRLAIMQDEIDRLQRE